MDPFGQGQVFAKSMYALFSTHSAEWEGLGPLKERLDKHLAPLLFELWEGIMASATFTEWEIEQPRQT